MSINKFQFFMAPITTVSSNTVMSVSQAYNYITTNEKAKVNTEKLRCLINMANKGIADSKEPKKFKADNFDSACFSGTFSKRKDSCLIMHSNLICLDFDHLGNQETLDNIKKSLINDEFFTTWLIFTSPSGDGLKWVVDIDLSKGSHDAWFKAIKNYIYATYKLNVDEKCGNVSRACFLPHDSNCYANPELFKNK